MATVDNKNAKMVSLVSKQGESFEVAVEVAKLSGLVKTMIQEDDDSTETQGAEIQEIPLPNVDVTTLVKVIDFLKHHHEESMNEIDKPLISAKMEDVVQEWYVEYLRKEQDFLFELILASNYMDIQPLIDLTCSAVAAMVKERSKEELFAAFGITEDFTPEEEIAVRNSNKWAEERGY